MTDRELENLEKDARRPNRGAKYYAPSVVLALIEELKKMRRHQVNLFSDEAEEQRGVITAKLIEETMEVRR